MQGLADEVLCNANYSTISSDQKEGMWSDLVSLAYEYGNVFFDKKLGTIHKLRLMLRRSEGLDEV